MLLTKLSIRRPVAMMMLILALAIFGVIGFLSLPIDLMPDIEFPYVTVQTIYPGAGPEEIESSVIKQIEEQLSTVNNVKNMTSYASEGIGFIVLEFTMGVDPDIAAIDVKDKIDAILYKLPRDLQKPIISKIDINDQPILNLALTGPQSPELLRSIAEKQIKERLVKIHGVAQIATVGGKEREIHVNLHKHRLDALGISVQTVAGILAAQTANIPAGHISVSSKEYTIRVQGEYETIEQIRSIGIPVVGRDETAMVPLYTIADVEDSFKEIRELARFNSMVSIGLSVKKRNDANIVKVSQAVLKEVELLNKELPEGTRINIAQDRAKFVRQTVHDMYVNMLAGMGLTACMLFLFLGDWRVTIIAALTIPASIIISCIGLQAMGFTLNMITLMSLAISIGTLVTNAIIVLENIVRHRDSGMEVRDAAMVGASEIATAVFASVLTNVAVFLPMANMEGITGQFFKSLGLTIVIATITSLFLSFSFAPLLASRMLKGIGTKHGVHRKGGLEVVVDRLAESYLVLLRLSIRYRILTTITAMLLLAGTVVGIGPKLGMEFFPQGDQGMVTISLEMPSGTSMEETNRSLQIIEQRLLTIPEIATVYSSLGGEGLNTGVNFANLIVNLRDKKERARSTREVVKSMRPFLADIPDAKIVIKEAGSMGGGRSETDITVEITGESMEHILIIADSVQSLAQTVPGLVDFQLSWKAAKPEIKFIPKRQILDEYASNVATMGLSMRTSITGSEAAVFRVENDEYTIRVQYAEKDRITHDAIENVTIQTPKGSVPAKALSLIKEEGGAANINRKNRQRLITVMANVSAGAIGTKTAELRALTDSLKLPPGIKIHFGGQQEMMNESFRTLLFTMILAIFLTFMVLAGSIESLTQPFLIMFTIPLGLVGILWALFITGQTISMISLMSTIMLIGVVVNNAILIIDYAHNRQKQGLPKLDSIIDACRVKFSAVIMMNLAIVLAMLPQALSGSGFQAPFAITAIGGIVVSTIMTLLVIPALYMFTRERKQPVQATEPH